MFKKSYIKKCDALLIAPLIQDEIVELCKNLPKYKNKTYIQLLSHFRVGLGKIYCSSYLATQSLNDMWLIFYIHEKEGKVWIEGNNKWM